MGSPFTNSEQELMPFAVVGSEKTVVVNGRNVRGRQNKWGIINGKSILGFCS